MLLTQFILVDVHFILSLIAALVFFAIAWLYFDAKERQFFFGFLFLAISFVAEAIIIDQTVLTNSMLGAGVAALAKNIFRILGYLVLIISQFSVPLQPVPKVKDGTNKSVGAGFVSSGALSAVYAAFSLPLLAAAAGILYLRRATVGLEDHLKPIALGFFVLSISEILDLAALFRNTNNINILNLVSPFGILWTLEQVFLFIAILIFGKWVWGYLLKRFDSQLFIIFATTSLIIFLTTTMFFTYATLNNLTQAAYDNIRTDSGVLNYSIESKKAELLSSAEVVAQNPGLAQAIENDDKKSLSGITSPVLLSKKESSLIVASSSGEILFKAENPDSSGGSLSSNSLVKRALSGTEVSGVSTKDGVTAPVVVISAAVPVNDGTTTVGTVLIGYNIDNAFTDGIKAATGLDASIYADNIRSATTFVAPDGVSRYIGIKENDPDIKKTVLSDGKTYTGSVDILNVPYFATFSPLTDADNNPVGMIFTGRPQVSVLQTAAQSLELTFLVTVVLLILSLFPAYYVSKYISDQIR